MKSTKISFISIFSISFKFASEKGIFSELEPKQVSGFSVNLQRGTLMMENPTQPENRTGHERLKLVGIKNLWMFRELIEKCSIRPTKRGQKPKLTSEVTWPLCQNDIKSSLGAIPSTYKPILGQRFRKKSFN